MNYVPRTCSKLTALSSRRLLLSNRCQATSATSSFITNKGKINDITAPTRTGYTTISSPCLLPQRRCFATNPKLWKNHDHQTGEESAKQANRKDEDAQEEEVTMDISDAVKQQIKRPWLREGADEPPVSQDRKDMNKTMGKGTLLTTPTRLLKLVLPLPVDALHDEHGNKGEFRAIAQNEDIQPLALLVHPQQPLSYLERLIQAELPPVRDRDGREKVPTVYFLAEGSERDAKGHKKHDSDDRARASDNIDDSYSGLGREGADTPQKHKDWVRWSSSTEIGDFIRDAARGREFAIDIDGLGAEVRVGVPSFNDRTHYMRTRLRRMSRRVEQQAALKHECDILAHRGAHRLAKAGFGALSAWWATVYFVTFHTDAGWDLVEPVTCMYLAGLTTIMGGYLWFLFISRDLSYQAALKITVSRRQNVLYQARGFDPQQWEALVQDANALRREIRTIAEEYDVDWDEVRDLGGEDVVEVLDKEDDRRRKNGGNGEDNDEDGGGGGGGGNGDGGSGGDKKKDDRKQEAKADPKHKPEGK